MMKVNLRVSTNKVGSDSYDVIEIDEEDLKGLSQAEMEQEIDRQVFGYICENMIDWGWGEVVD